MMFGGISLMLCGLYLGEVYFWERVNLARVHYLNLVLLVLIPGNVDQPILKIKSSGCELYPYIWDALFPGGSNFNLSLLVNH